MIKMNDKIASQMLIRVAKTIAAAEGDAAGAEIDAAFASKIKDLRAMLPKLVNKKSKTLRQLGVEGVIKTSDKVEALIDVLLNAAKQ